MEGFAKSGYTLRVGPIDIDKAIPKIWEWMQESNAKHAAVAKRLDEYAFGRLRDCFSRNTLERARVVEISGMIPRPPLRSLGLAEFAAFEDMDLAGITFGHTYFIKQSHSANESLHFHELVHVIQWQALGPMPFLEKYARELAHVGYRNCSLEAMAYDLQNRFDANGGPIDAEETVRQAGLITRVAKRARIVRQATKARLTAGLGGGGTGSADIRSLRSLLCFSSDHTVALTPG